MKKIRIVLQDIKLKKSREKWVKMSFKDTLDWELKI